MKRFRNEDTVKVVHNSQTYTGTVINCHVVDYGRNEKAYEFDVLVPQLDFDHHVLHVDAVAYDFLNHFGKCYNRVKKFILTGEPQHNAGGFGTGRTGWVDDKTVEIYADEM